MKTCFGPYTLDPDTRQVTEGTRVIHLAPKAFELLSVLLAERPNVLSKAVLQERLWPGSFVVEANLSNLVAEIRDRLRDRPRAPRFIRTAHGFGYAFCGEARPMGATRLEPPQCWLECGRLRFPLAAGTHVIGRDAGADIRLDGSMVSRRHAKVVVTQTGTVLEDFDSKNGTFHGDQRVTAPVALADGDALRIGSMLLTFHVRVRSTTTDTMARPSR